MRVVEVDPRQSLLLVAVLVVTLLLLATCGGDEGDGAASKVGITTPDAQATNRQGTLPGGLDVDRLVAASRTTNSPYVLITVVDGNTDESRTAAASFDALELALGLERGLSPREVIDFLRATESRRFVFKDPVALRNIWPRYSAADLDEVRELLGTRSVEQIVSDQADSHSSLCELGRRKHGGPYGCLPCVLHVLLERGAFCSASCVPGLVYVDDERVGGDG